MKQLKVKISEDWIVCVQYLPSTLENVLINQACGALILTAGAIPVKIPIRKASDKEP